MQHNSYKLTHKLIFKRNSSDGTTKPNWEQFCTVYAEKKGLIGRNFYAAAAEQNESGATYTIHFRRDIKAGMRFTDTESGINYEVYGDPIDSDGCRKWLEIHARRVEHCGT